MSERETPRAPEEERLVLAAVLRGTKHEQTEVTRRLDKEMFDAWGTVARAVWAIDEAGDVADVETVEAELGAKLPEKITSARPPTDNLERYCAEIQEAWGKRYLGGNLYSLADRAFRGEELDGLREEAEDLILEVSQQTHQSAVRPVGAFVDEVMDGLEQQEGEEVVGVPSGLSDVDSRTRGWHDGDLIVIAGRPHMGKSAFVLNCLLHAAKEGYTVALITLEMPARQVVERLVFIESGVAADPGRKVIHRSEQDWTRLREAAKTIRRLPFHIADEPTQTPVDVIAVLRRLCAEQDIDIAAIDYLQKMKAPNSNEDWVGNAAHRIQGEAQSLGIPVMLVSQLNRYLEHRSDKRPQMSDLRESGGIEEAADLIQFLYRAEYYDIDVDDYGNATDGVAEHIMAKDRTTGNTGIATLSFDDSCGRFADLERREEPEPTGGPSYDEDLNPRDGMPF